MRNALSNHGVTHPVETIRPRRLGDGQSLEGVPADRVHHGPRPDYDSAEGRKHREDLRERPRR